jgi:hypothetical protein
MQPSWKPLLACSDLAFSRCFSPFCRWKNTVHKLYFE